MVRVISLPAAEVVARLRRAGVQVALAESCTGGAAMSALTSIPGASACVWGGLVVYTTAAKQALAGVPAELLAADGPVSAQVAVALAEGLRLRVGTAMAASVTGWAGPESAGPDPVGTVYLAVATDRETRTWRRDYTGSRDDVRIQAAGDLLSLVGEAAEQIGRTTA